MPTESHRAEARRVTGHATPEALQRYQAQGASPTHADCGAADAQPENPEGYRALQAHLREAHGYTGPCGTRAHLDLAHSRLQGSPTLRLRRPQPDPRAVQARDALRGREHLPGAAEAQLAVEALERGEDLPALRWGVRAWLEHGSWRALARVLLGEEGCHGR